MASFGLSSESEILGVISLVGLICGLVIGTETETIRFLDPNILDIGVTTPVTTCVVHGLLLLPVTIVGCYSSVKSRIIHSVAYVVLIVLFIVYDQFAEFNVLFNFSEDPVGTFFMKLNESMDGYAPKTSAKSKSVGIIPIPATVYWEHLQRRAKCCGLKSVSDWKKTPFSKDKGHIPDSCCNEEYDYRYCGHYVFRHPDIVGHTQLDLVHKRGCIDVFPESMRPGSNSHLSLLGLFTGALLILCGVLTIVLLLFVLLKCFNPDDGLNTLGYVDKESKVELAEGKRDRGEQLDSHYIPSDSEDRRQNGRDLRVHPMGDMKQNHPYKTHVRHHHSAHPPGDPMNQRSAQKIKFYEPGPQFIPTDNDSSRPNSANNSRRNY